MSEALLENTNRGSLIGEKVAPSASTLSFLIYFNFTVLVIALYFVGWTFAEPGTALHQAFFAEDHFGEWLQFIVCVVTSLYCVRFFRDVKNPVLRGGSLLGAFGMFFLAGEEISWGQRIFGFESSYFQNQNYQGETNLHNLLPLESNLIPYFGAVIVIGVVLNFIGWKYSPVGAWPWKGFAMSSLLMGLLYWALPMQKHLYFYEYTEIWIYGSLLLFTVHLRRIIMADEKGRVRATI